MSAFLNPEDFEIVWVVLPGSDPDIPYFLLDERYPGEFSSEVWSHQNCLDAGRMCGRDVLIARFFEGPPINFPYNLFSEMRNKFPNLLLGLIVGIQETVPDLTQIFSEDVRLGDLLVGLLNGETAERTAYRLSKEADPSYNDASYTPEKGQARETMNSNVQTAISDIELEAPSDTHRFFDYYGALKIRGYHSKRFIDPGQNFDILYRTNGDGIEKRVKGRVPRTSRQRTRVWHGPVDPGKYYATQDPKFWGIFKENKDMGTRLPVYVIRGICNYGDGHDTSKWRSYAAAMAGAYAKAVLDKIRPRELNIANTASGFERDDTERADNLRSRAVQQQTSQIDSTSTSSHSTTGRVEKEEVPQNLSPEIARWPMLFPIFHRSMLMAVVLVFGLLGGAMITLAVIQTRDPVCNPTRDTLVTDDGFWTMLSQLCFLVLTIYCTLYPVVLRSKRREAFINKFWFMGLLLISFMAAGAAVITYPWNWKAATILWCASSFVQVLSTAQLANSLEPMTDNEYLPRRGTFEMEELRSR
ncbi:hypothetical protein PFICI_09315 [Pestalotiopsis fici W106-1]|uniref:Uncharacterized protein n=1 Tax=Pestalotiopsis fici (strain W106-1 / CGMCC3.15140) TaxID=1229662 RepID=W3X256_PESFW|nr:uncharacterized protein PFICI_09315 [Pestalotiopsis fici W106-1]ETS79462.1 hypothetical protein PFICI_09315 [Pestalotiopsis fici W106-1]